MLRVSSRQRLVSWDAFDATASSTNSRISEEEEDDYYYAEEDEIYLTSFVASQQSHLVLDDSLAETKTQKKKKRDRRSSSSSKNSNTTVAIATSITFLDLAKDVHLNILSFLSVSDLRAISETNSYNLSLTRKYRVWHPIFQRQWPLLFCSEQQQHIIRYKDSTGIPLAAAATNDNTKEDLLNFSVLYKLAQQTAHPTQMDPTIFLPPSPYRTFLIQPHKVRVLQYTGAVGRGDRCIRADQFFPSLKSNLKEQTRWCPQSIFDLLCRGGTSTLTLMEEGALSSSNTSFPTLEYHPTNNVFCRSWSLCGITTLKPFVSPYVTHIQENKDNTGMKEKIVNISPRLFAYFEITLYEPEESQELPSIVSSSTYLRGRTNRRASRQSFLQDDPNEDDVHTSECVAIGLASERFVDWQDRMPGWDKHSYGYHGDDGGIFHGKGHMIRRFGPRYGTGDTVGCGIDYANQSIFFCLNGQFLGYAFEKVDLSLIPVIGVDTHIPIGCNFGERPFVFDVSTPFTTPQHKALIETAFDGFPFPNSTTIPTAIPQHNVSSKKIWNPIHRGFHPGAS